jgi:hypothetical protein
MTTGLKRIGIEQLARNARAIGLSGVVSTDQYSAFSLVLTGHLGKVDERDVLMVRTEFMRDDSFDKDLQIISAEESISRKHIENIRRRQTPYLFIFAHIDPEKLDDFMCGVFEGDKGA